MRQSRLISVLDTMETEMAEDFRKHKESKFARMRVRRPKKGASAQQDTNAKTIDLYGGFNEVVMSKKGHKLHRRKW